MTPSILHTTVGSVPLAGCRIEIGGRTWAVAYTVAIVTHGDEYEFLDSRAKASDELPYGVALWPAALALAHEIATRQAEFHGKTVLELGAGTGLPGIVAAGYAAAVTQTDKQELVLHVAKQNGERNRAAGITYRLADWNEWDDAGKYDWIIGSDILYVDTFHTPLRRIFEANLAPGGRLLLADPYRADSMPLLEALEAAGWRVTHTHWSVGEVDPRRGIAVYELVPPTFSPR